MIVNLSTGKVYSSIAEASRVAGVNSGSISAAVAGKRKSAGGYQWANVPTESAAEALVRAAQAVERKATAAQKERRKQQRKRSRERAAETRRAEKKKRAAEKKERRKQQQQASRSRVSPETMAARSSAKAAFRAINRARAKLIKLGSPNAVALRQIEELIRQLVGEDTAAGGYLRESDRYIAEWSDTTLEQATAEINNTLSSILARRDESANIIMLSFSGLDRQKAIEWEPAIGAFLDAIGQLRQLAARAGGDGKYKEIYSAVTASAYRGTMQDIIDITETIMQRVRADQAVTADWVSDVVGKWREEVGNATDIEPIAPIRPNW